LGAVGTIRESVNICHERMRFAAYVVRRDQALENRPIEQASCL
jgi:hypothetical protein